MSNHDLYLRKSFPAYILTWQMSGGTQNEKIEEKKYNIMCVWSLPGHITLSLLSLDVYLKTISREAIQQQK